MHLYLVTIVYTCCLYMKKALFLAVPHLKVPPVGHGTSASFSPALVTCPSALIQPTGVIPKHQWSRRGVTSCQFHGMVGTYEIIGAKTEQRIACWAWHYGGKIQRPTQVVRNICMHVRMHLRRYTAAFVLSTYR